MPARKSPAKKAPAKPARAAASGSKPATPAKASPAARGPTRAERQAQDLKAADEGYTLARENAVKYLHSRRQATFALARHFHVDADDLQQEAFEVLLTCLRDFNPVYTRADGSSITVQFNTFFGSRLESKAMELRNRDPEYQARQAHMQDMSDGDKADFRKNPPLLVQHLDQETTVQEHLRGEVAAAQRARQTNVMLKIAQDSFIEKKLNDLIAAERDDKRRAALMHVKVGGVASFEEIAYHFGVTDSRASQILNELMDAFYTQRLLEGDLKSIAYDFRKLGLQDKRAQRLLAQAMRHAPAPRAAEIAAIFGVEYPHLQDVLAKLPKMGAAEDAPKEEVAPGNAHPAKLTAEEEKQFPLRALEWRPLSGLSSLGVTFRPADTQAPQDLGHIRQIAAHPAENWPPLLITEDGQVIDGERRIAAAAARGEDRLLCQVLGAPKGSAEKALRQLRVCINSRVRPLDKLELYFAISALIGLGLTQGNIAQALGTSRPNVIVYAKVRNNSTPRLRQLFEEGLIQITNASSAADLAPQAQDAIADFIRQHGASWGRGPQFNDLYQAAVEGSVDDLSPLPSAAAPLPHMAAAPLPPAAVPLPPSPATAGAPTAIVNALKKRQEALENALRDAEVWTRQREATIATQTSQINEMKQQVESLKRELEAQSLLQHGDSATMANYIKEIKNFYSLEERLAAAAYHLEKAQSQRRSMHLTHRQTIELEKVLEKIAAVHNALRVSLVKSAT